jgi:NADPH-dependent glutamate synthase beta subunit-like oxidoreductase
VQNRFTELSNEPNVYFYGNVEVGKDIHVEELKKFFQVIIFAYGCSTPNRLNIDGENANCVYNATDFTNWYNGAPFQYQQRQIDLRGESVVIIGIILIAIEAYTLGNGNVAIDLARILGKPTSDLMETDIPTPVLKQLAQSKVKNV